MAAPIPIPSGATIEPPKAVPIPTDATVDAPETTGQHLKRIGKTLGRNTAVTAAGASPMMAGAELGAEAGTAIEPGIGTAIGGVAGGAIVGGRGGGGNAAAMADPRHEGGAATARWLRQP